MLRQSRELTMLGMLPTKPSNNELRSRLRALDAEFERELRARGFDPAQADNVALPSRLAALYAEREKIKAEIEESERENP